jgi:hypothetical protein
MPRSSRRKLRWGGCAALVLLVASAAWFFWPRPADLRGFDPEAVARIETRMWRHYYDREYANLFRAMYSLSRDVYHFSPWDSTRLAWFAAKSARIFQPTRGRAEAQAALPDLVRYYGVIRERSAETFDPSEAARLELEWWQLRREEATPAQYGAVVAQVTEELYGVKNDALRKSGQLRAEMMEYRDERRDTGLEEGDWMHIKAGLTQAYELLKSGINSPR